MLLRESQIIFPKWVSKNWVDISSWELLHYSLLWDFLSFAILRGALPFGKGKVYYSLMLEHADHVKRAKFTRGTHNSFETPASKHRVIQGQVWTLMTEAKAQSGSWESNITCWLMWKEASNKTLSIFEYFPIWVYLRRITLAFRLLTLVDPASASSSWLLLSSSSSSLSQGLWECVEQALLSTWDPFPDPFWLNFRNKRHLNSSLAVVTN